SLIETDSDRFVIEYLSPALRKKLDTSSVQWTDLQNMLLKEYHDEVGSSDVVREALTKVPLDPAMIQVCQLLHSSGWTLAVISDANTVYIDSILKHYGIRDLFSAIITNPAFFDDQDRLQIHRHIPADGPPHGCPLGICSLNICKGQEMDKLLLSPTGSPVAPKRILYVGDGRNDYCPGLRLRHHDDLYFVRRGRSLERYFETGPGVPNAIRGKIVYWERPSEILRELQQVITLNSL
ncbi:hypothetical protein BGW38_005239, partial [Lunasporangiospora selenospora]